MLTLIVPGEEYFNEKTEEFETVGDIVLSLEHSLVSLSKWESIHQIPFLGKEARTPDEILSYVRCMIVCDYSPDIFSRMSQENVDAITKYIESKESATTFGTMPEQKGQGEIITSELIYYWMVAFQIPFECEHWHLNRLFALIRICNIKNSKPKKMSRQELARRNRDLNAQRREKFNTHG